MTVKERILTIRLLQMMEKQSEYAKLIGLVDVTKNSQKYTCSQHGVKQKRK